MSLMLSDDDDELILNHGAAPENPQASAKVNRDVAKDAHERQGLLGNSSEDEDDFFLKGPRMSKGSLFPDRDKGALSGLQKQVQDVTDIMKENVNRMLDRGERLDDLQMRSEHLENASSDFRSSANAASRKFWWQNAKTKAVAGVSATVVGIIILIIIFT